MGNSLSVCVLVPELNDNPSQEIIAGIVNRASFMGIEITVISAGAIMHKKFSLKDKRLLYKSVIEENHFDGIISLSGSFSFYYSSDEIKEFLNSIAKSTPLVNVSIKIQGYHSVSVDNVTPIKEVVNHLIIDHKKKKIMFIKGPLGQDEAEARFSGYCEALKENGFNLDNDYVLEGNFSTQKASESIKLFIESGLELPDAIVCANDESALGVYTQLKNSKIDIKKQGISLTGYDNRSYGKSMDPGLTTIDQLFEKQGKTAIENLFTLIRNGDVNNEPFIPKIFYRESCGCSSKNDDFETRKGLTNFISNRFYNNGIEGLEDDVSAIDEIFFKILDYPDYDFVQEIEYYINKYIYKGYDLKLFAEMLKIVNVRVLPRLEKEQLISYFNQIDRINFLIVEAISRQTERELHRVDEQIKELDDISLTLSSCISYESLSEELNRDFFHLGIKRVSIRIENSSNPHITQLNNRIYEKGDSLNRTIKNYINLILPLSSKKNFGYCHYHVLHESFHNAEVITFQLSRALYLIDLLDDLYLQLKTINNDYRNLRETKDLLMRNDNLANIGGLVAGFTHEINTPIGVGLTAITYLLDEIKGIKKTFNNNILRKSDMSSFIENSQKTTEIVLNNLEKAITLIQGFKQISVDQASELKRPFELCSYMQEIVQSINPVLRNGNHRVKLHHSQEINLDSYPGAVSQIITNLIQNSVKHGFENIVNGTINISIFKDDDNVIIDYRDNGCGIKSEYIYKIFDPYYTTKVGKGGSGLGLSIIKKITEEKLHGTIICDPVFENGVCFKITIPYSKNS